MKLIDDWRRAKHWASMWFAGSGLAFNVLAAAAVKGVTVSVAFLGFVPLIWLPIIAAALSAMTLAARVVKQKRKASK